ncbi:hypothetical protein A9G41_03165 [Gilliamella sp. Nev5-1]|uniref:hypothetical protein n=1 Tax=unclassified Gilliamella TaxID=2685620 RepID=UPI00080DC7D1|nr:hypothetical protein [Gilliamella apicola]OCG61148.1 hypothetical protein A9G40_01520 [Gilliamella apicola]OCG71163.1 hypothetical protein A9G41_03165 [Gilliamella apicola]
MPILSLTTSVDVEQSKLKQIAKNLTELTSQFLRKNKDVTVVNILPHHGSWFGVNGLVDGAVYQLTIFITAGTNTENEVSSWLSGTWEYLKTEFSIPDNAICYTSVVNNDGINWGFNGISQSTRSKL